MSKRNLLQDKANKNFGEKKIKNLDIYIKRVT